MTVTVEHVQKKFKSNRALDDVSLRLENGVYGLLGPNGSGKTTLLRCLTNVYRDYSGSIAFDGQTVRSNRSVLTKVGYLPQGFGLFRELTVAEMLAYFCTLKKLPPQKQADAIDSVLELVNLTGERNKRVGALSGGMIRRAGIAQAMLGEPELIILDEPTAGLDPEERLRFKNAVMKKKGGCIILLSTHIVEDVDALCEKIIVLSSGKIGKQGAPEEIRACAKGAVYEISQTRENELKGSYTVIKQENRDGQDRLRLLSREPQPGEPQEPTVEDGYLAIIQGQEHA